MKNNIKINDFEFLLQKCISIVRFVALFKVQFYIFVVLLNIYIFGNILKIYGVFDMLYDLNDNVKPVSRCLAESFADGFNPRSDGFVSVDTRLADSGYICLHVKSCKSQFLAVRDMQVDVLISEDFCSIGIKYQEREPYEYILSLSDYANISTLVDGATYIINEELKVRGYDVIVESEPASLEYVCGDNLGNDSIFKYNRENIRYVM